MNFPRLAVHRPVLTGVLLLIVVSLGIFSVWGIQLDLLPDMNLPVAAVIAGYDGAGPSEVEAHITRPLEEALATIGGVENIQSLSREGGSLIIVEFDWGIDIREATRQMREAIDRARPFLPDDAGDPRVLQFDPADLPIVTLGLAGPGDDPAQLQQVAEDLIVPRLERVAGVASVTLDGGRRPEVQVRVDPSAIRS
ncbi:MAG: efflux RND transporter permease subunit, partial [Thermaerobacterales bacterium]